MTERDEYLQKFKEQLDKWNADIDKLETKAHEAQVDAQAHYHEQLESLRAMRDDAQKRYNEMQGAAADAWDVMVQGTEKAWEVWFETLENARSKFKPKD